MSQTESPRPFDGDRLLTPQEVSEILRVTRWTVYDLVRKGELAVIKITTRAQRIRESQVRDYLERHLHGR